MNENENIEIRNEEVQEILGNIPSWIVRWGTSIVVGLLLFLIGGSFIYRSPSVIHETITITTENPPAKVIARSDGQIASLFVTDKQSVTSGEPLAVIENPAAYQDIWKLKSLLDSISLQNPARNLSPSTYLDLGEVQPHYESFKKAYDTYWHFHDLQYYPQKAVAIQNELKKYMVLLNQLKEQNTIILDDLLLLQKQYQRDSTLHADGVISDQAMDQSKANLLQKKLKYHESLSKISETELDIAQLQEVQIDNRNNFEQLKKQHQLRLNETYENLKAEINIWENKYVLISPISGNISFMEYWSTNQSVTSGSTVMMVIPKDQGAIIGKLALNQDGAGKVKAGKKVIIKLRNYPYLEYGVLEGKVAAVSMAAENDMFSVFVDLPDKLITNYGITLDFTYDMEGNAEIITQDILLINKLLNPIKSVLKRNSS
jgi:multidrug resistance efflux pump